MGDSSLESQVELTENKMSSSTSATISPKPSSSKDDNGPSSPQSTADIEIPLSIITKIVKESLPQGVKVSQESRVAIAKAASIFVLYCTSSANNLVMENKGKTLRDIDILSAIQEMDFGEFIPKLKENLEAFRTCTKNKREAALQRKKLNAIQTVDKEASSSVIINDNSMVES